MSWQIQPLLAMGLDLRSSAWIPLGFGALGLVQKPGGFVFRLLSPSRETWGRWRWKRWELHLTVLITTAEVSGYHIWRDPVVDPSSSSWVIMSVEKHRAMEGIWSSIHSCTMLWAEMKEIRPCSYMERHRTGRTWAGKADWAAQSGWVIHLDMDTIVLCHW